MCSLNSTKTNKDYTLPFQSKIFFPRLSSGQTLLNKIWLAAEVTDQFKISHDPQNWKYITYSKVVKCAKLVNSHSTNVVPFPGLSSAPYPKVYLIWLRFQLRDRYAAAY